MNTLFVDNNNVGIGTKNPDTLLQLEGDNPYLTLKNSTAEHSDGGAETKIIFKDHSNTSLAEIEASHDGSSDDTKGDLIFFTHSGSALRERLKIDSTGTFTIKTSANEITIGNLVAGPYNATGNNQKGQSFTVGSTGGFLKKIRSSGVGGVTGSQLTNGIAATTLKIRQFVNNNETGDSHALTGTILETSISNPTIINTDFGAQYPTVEYLFSGTLFLTKNTQYVIEILAGSGVSTYVRIPDDGDPYTDGQAYDIDGENHHSTRDWPFELTLDSLVEALRIDNTGATTFGGGLVDLTPTLSTITDVAITAAAGTEYIVNDANGGAMTLPAAASGIRIIILIGTTITSNTITITAQSGDLLKGNAFLEKTDGANNKTMFSPDGTDDLIITLNGSTKGGLVGDRIELVGISATEWRVRAILSHTGTAATPFS